MRPPALCALALLIAALACSPFSPGGRPAPTPLFRTATPAPLPSTSRPISVTETPLGVFPPTHTPDPRLREATPTESQTPTTTASPTTPAQGAPLSIQRVEAAEIRRDPSRSSGAIVVVRVVFTGGVPPFTFFDEGLLQKGNPYELTALCQPNIAHTARVESADGQTASLAYFIGGDCP